MARRKVSQTHPKNTVAWFITVTLLLLMTIWACIMTVMYVFQQSPTKTAVPVEVQRLNQEIQQLEQLVKQQQQQPVTPEVKNTTTIPEVHLTDLTTKNLFRSSLGEHTSLVALVQHTLEQVQPEQVIWWSFTEDVKEDPLPLLTGLAVAPYVYTGQEVSAGAGEVARVNVVRKDKDITSRYFLTSIPHEIHHLVLTYDTFMTDAIHFLEGFDEPRSLTWREFSQEHSERTFVKPL